VKADTGTMSASNPSSSSDSRLIAVAQDGWIVEIGLQNGPLNLVTGEMLRALDRVVADVASREDVRCVILHGGTARAFCAGSDIGEFESLRHDASERKILYEDMILRNLAALPVPTIAALDGPALGGGLEIALACDLRIARAGVALGLPECRLGGLAGTGAVRLARLVGPARAKEMLFGGESIDALQALAWGLVNRVVEQGSALDAARSLASTIASRGPLSNRFAKSIVDAAGDQPAAAALSMATAAQRRIFESDDLHEGAAAFFAKRSPAFKGR
jgi:enoyl-CoA hydratase/carnithine racemase